MSPTAQLYDFDAYINSQMLSMETNNSFESGNQQHDSKKRQLVKEMSGKHMLIKSETSGHLLTHTDRSSQKIEPPIPPITESQPVLLLESSALAAKKQ